MMGNTASSTYPPVQFISMRMAQPVGHYPRENATSQQTFDVQKAMWNTTHMHISCANSCLSAAASNGDFVGVCFYAENGNIVYNDGGRRIRSGYIYVEPASNLNSSGTLHQQTMDKIFSANFCRTKGFAVVGFAQQGKELKGRSGTCNGTSTTNLLNDSKEMFFLYRTPIFGALIVYKICCMLFEICDHVASGRSLSGSDHQRNLAKIMG